LPEREITFSVIVPTYNRLHLLKKTLESLFRQDFPDYEIVVVNDGSSDGTKEYLESLQAAGKVRCFHQVNQGPARGRNLALANARYDFIAFIDDDCLAPRDWLSSYAARLTEWGCDGIGGSARTGNPDNIYALTNDHIMNFFKSTNSADTKVPFLTSNNAVYRKTALDRVGGFDSGFWIMAEERDLNLRLAESGATLRYHAHIAITHFNDETFGKFVRHQLAAGRGSRRLYGNAHARGANLPIGATPRDYVNLFRSPFREFGPVKGMAVLLLIVLAQAMVTVGFFSAKVKHSSQG
jgi:glycosyltransferase involved in cell wall biosynthesis